MLEKCINCGGKKIDSGKFFEGRYYKPSYESGKVKKKHIIEDEHYNYALKVYACIDCGFVHTFLDPSMPLDDLSDMEPNDSTN